MHTLDFLNISCEEFYALKEEMGGLDELYEWCENQLTGDYKITFLTNNN